MAVMDHILAWSGESYLQCVRVDCNRFWSFERIGGFAAHHFCMFAFLIGLWATPTRDIITGLYQLKISVVFAMVVGIVLRLIPQFQAEHGIILEAQKSRATEFDKGGLMARFRKHTAYIIPLSLRALKIVSDLSVAMESRAFDPYGKRTFVRASKFSRMDKILLVLMVVFLIGSILIRVFWLRKSDHHGFSTGQ